MTQRNEKTIAVELTAREWYLARAAIITFEGDRCGGDEGEKYWAVVEKIDTQTGYDVDEDRIPDE